MQCKKTFIFFRVLSQVVKSPSFSAATLPICSFYCFLDKVHQTSDQIFATKCQKTTFQNRCSELERYIVGYFSQFSAKYQFEKTNPKFSYLILSNEQHGRVDWPLGIHTVRHLTIEYLGCVGTIDPTLGRGWP